MADGRTPLYIAAENGHEKYVSLLLKKGADRGLLDNGSTLLDLAIKNQHEEYVRILEDIATKNLEKLSTKK